MKDLFKIIFDLIDNLVKWILRLIPGIIAIISMLIAYYSYNKESYQNFYCYDGEKCFGKKSNIDKPFLNTCGTSGVNSTPYKIYNSLEECNKEFEYKNYDKKTCLSKSRFLGWYVNSEGKGSCVRGTPEGPNDITLNYQLDGTSKKNRYYVGNPSSFIM